jgi:hypothetical protein
MLKYNQEILIPYWIKSRDRINVEKIWRVNSCFKIRNAWIISTISVWKENSEQIDWRIEKVTKTIEFSNTTNYDSTSKKKSIDMVKFRNSVVS